LNSDIISVKPTAAIYSRGVSVGITT